MLIELQFFHRVAVVKIADLVCHHRNFHVTKERAEVNWALPKEEKGLLYNAGDDPWLSISHEPDVLYGEDGSSN